MRPIDSGFRQSDGSAPKPPKKKRCQTARRRSVLHPGGTASGPGGMAEWTIAAVLKTVNPSRFVGSNPTPSANLAAFPIKQSNLSAFPRRPKSGYTSRPPALRRSPSLPAIPPRACGHIHRHSGASRNPGRVVRSTVIPAQAGIQGAWSYPPPFRLPQPSFRRKPESRACGHIHRHSDFSVIPAKAGIYSLRWTPVFAGMTDPHLNHLKRNTTAAGAGLPSPHHRRRAPSDPLNPQIPKIRVKMMTPAGCRLRTPPVILNLCQVGKKIRFRQSPKEGNGH